MSDRQDFPPRMDAKPTSDSRNAADVKRWSNNNKGGRGRKVIRLVVIVYTVISLWAK